MSALLVLILLALTAVFLAGGVIYLYRWLVRRRLFPQLPRLWRGDRQRFFISSTLFVLSLCGFIAVVLFTGGEPAPPQIARAPEAAGPSFDGQPPPQVPAYGQRQAPTEERALPPRQEAPQAAELAGQEKPAALPAGDQAAGDAAATAMARGEQPADQAGQGGEPAASAAPASAQTQDQAQAQGQASAGAETAAQPSAPEPSAQEPAAPQPEPVPQPEAVAEPQPAPAAKPQAPAKAQPAPEPKAQPKAQAKAEPKTAPKAAPKAQDKAQGEYTVAAASFRKEGMARTFQKQLSSLGLKGEIHQVDLGPKGVWYRVCLGRFPTAAAAAAQARAYQEQGLVKSPFPTRLR